MSNFYGHIFLGKGTNEVWSDESDKEIPIEVSDDEIEIAKPVSKKKG